MNYLKKYISFLEDFDVREDDKEDVKISKEGLKELQEQISEFNSKKASIDNIYKSKDKDIGNELEKILGKENRNPFLVSYSNIARIKKELEDLQKKGDDKAIELSNFKDRLSIAEDAESKLALSDKIKEIEQQISDIKSKLQEKSDDIPTLEKELEDNLSKKEDDVKKWIDNIQ
jgi:gas vesicle protein